MLADVLLAEFGSDPTALEALADRLAPLIAARQPTRAEDGWIDTRTAAEYLGLTRTSLHRLTAERAVPFEQDGPGAKCWFKRSELDAWRRVNAVDEHPAWKHSRKRQITATQGKPLSPTPPGSRKHGLA
jgi:excisionase family DNA binding protein